MKKIVILLLIAVISFGLLPGCSAGGTNVQNSRIITDGAGRQVEIPENVESVVCVGVGALRYTCYMGAASLVTGVEDYEVTQGIDRLYNYINHEKFKNLPIIGTNGVPYAEEIIPVAPQVIVLSKSANADADNLQAQTGTPVVVIPGSDTTLDNNAYETIRILGELYGMEDRAKELSAYLKGIQEDLDMLLIC